MRARHWKQVLRFAKGGPVHLLGRGGTFDPSVLEELTFGQLLDMGLHSESTIHYVYIHMHSITLAAEVRMLVHVLAL